MAERAVVVPAFPVADDIATLSAGLTEVLLAFFAFFQLARALRKHARRKSAAFDSAPPFATGARRPLLAPQGAPPRGSGSRSSSDRDNLGSGPVLHVVDAHHVNNSGGKSGKASAVGKRRRDVERAFYVSIMACMLFRAGFHFAQPYYVRQSSAHPLYPYSLWVLLLSLGTIFYVLAFAHILRYFLMIYYDLRSMQLSDTGPERLHFVRRLSQILGALLLGAGLVLAVALLALWGNRSGVLRWINFTAAIFLGLVSFAIGVGYVVFAFKIWRVWPRLRLKTTRLVTQYRRIIGVSLFSALVLFARTGVSLLFGLTEAVGCFVSDKYRSCFEQHDYVVPWSEMLVLYLGIEVIPFVVLIWILHTKGSKRKQPHGTA
jgi:hypothetical protein